MAIPSAIRQALQYTEQWIPRTSSKEQRQQLEAWSKMLCSGLELELSNFLQHSGIGLHLNRRPHCPCWIAAKNRLTG